MLRTCTKDDFLKYSDFAYELATDLTKSSYPTYCDGIKTKAMFVERSLKAFERDTEDMFLFEHEGKVQGVIHYSWIPEDNYLSINSFNINEATEVALTEFLEYVGGKFKGYDLFMGFPAENKAAVETLSARGFELVGDDYNDTAHLDKLDNFQVSDKIIAIDKDNFESFRKLHDQIDGDMYWNSERMFEALENWRIFVREEAGEPQGAVYYTTAKGDWYEIFGIDINKGGYDSYLFKELINAALADAKSRGGRVMTFFCDEEGEADAKECGFECVGKYLCFESHLS